MSLLEVSSTTFNQKSPIQPNIIFRQYIMDDPKYHEYWHACGMPDDDEELKKDFYDPPIINISHTFITIALPKLPSERDEAREKVFEMLQKCRELPKYNYYNNMSIWFSLEFYSMEKQLKLLKNNFHIHILIKGKYLKFDRKRIIRDLARKFKVEQNFVDVKYHTCPELFKTRQQYIQGKKAIDSKDLAVQKDREERKVFEIEDFYFLS